MGVDDTLSNGGMRALALKISELSPDDVLFLRAPVAALGRDGGGSSCGLTPPAHRSCGPPSSRGQLATYVEQNSRDALGSVTR